MEFTHFWVSATVGSVAAKHRSKNRLALHLSDSFTLSSPDSDGHSLFLHEDSTTVLVRTLGVPVQVSPKTLVRCDNLYRTKRLLLAEGT